MAGRRPGAMGDDKPARLGAKMERVDLRRPDQRVVAQHQKPQDMAIRHAVGWLTSSASARRMEEIPLSDCRMNHSPMSQVRNGSFVPCNVVCVVTVNWKRQFGAQR